MKPIQENPSQVRRAGWLMALALLATLASALLLTALSGCATSSGIAPSAELMNGADWVGKNRDETPSAADAISSSAAPLLAIDWWKSFGDSTLTGLVEQALAGNPNLRVAHFRLARAQAGVENARGLEGLHGNASLEITRQRFTENGLIPPPIGGKTLDSGTLQAGVAWEFDFFGRNRVALESALGNQRAAQADVQAARVVLASNVTLAYVQLGRLLEQREWARRSLAQREEMLSLIRQRVQAGLDTTVELRQGEGALPETRQQLEALEEQIILTRHALAALTAQPPSACDGLGPRLQPLAGMPLPSAIPADLIGRRADVSALRWRVEATAQDVQAARLQFYPNLNLSAFVGLSSLGLDRLLKSGSRQYGAGPAVSLPIFDSARLRANLRGKTADLDSAVESYNAAVIDAVRDAADQISSLRSIERRQSEQALAQGAAESAHDLAIQRYQAGLGTYLVVLSAESNVLNQRRLSTDLKARAIDAQVGLVRALGGGYGASI